jgi:hypothetical protein
MKNKANKAAVIFMFSLMSVTLKAQVPNAGFESWSVEPTISVLMPDQWSSTAFPGIAVPVTSSATSHSGTLAARGEVLNTGLPYPADRLTPILISIPVGSEDFGFSVTEKYTELTGFYQFYPIEGDGFHAIATMFHDTTAIGTGCTTYYDSAETYMPFFVPIVYTSELNPNFCVITILIIPPSGTTDTHAGSYYLADDLELGGTSSVQDDEYASNMPVGLTLKQNYPNPFNPVTTISYDIPKPDRVRVHIYDLQGRLVKVLVDVNKEAGQHQVNWNGQDMAGQTVSSGVYYIRIVSGEFTDSKKIMFLK